MNWHINIKKMLNLKNQIPHEFNFIKHFPKYKKEILDTPQRPFEKCKSIIYGNNRFSGSDNEKTFEENLLKLGPEWKYATKEIIYNVNRDGYRTYEWEDVNDWNESIVLFGCSCTFGIGLAEDETLSFHLEKLTGRRVINLGVPGGSNYVMVNNCASLINYFGLPYAAVFNWTSSNRMRYYFETDYADIGIWNKDKDMTWLLKESPWKIDPYEILELVNKNPYNAYAIGQHMKKNVYAMLRDCKNIFNVTFFHDAFHIMECEKFFSSGMGAQTKEESKARDLQHPGNDSIIEVAQYIHERLSKNN